MLKCKMCRPDTQVVLQLGPLIIWEKGSGVTVGLNYLVKISLFHGREPDDLFQIGPWYSEKE